jgi:hypothetical protein
MSVDDNNNNQDQPQDADIGNPFIIKKRKLLPIPSVRSICIFKKPMQMDFFYAFIETIQKLYGRYGRYRKQMLQMQIPNTRQRFT